MEEGGGSCSNGEGGKAAGPGGGVRPPRGPAARAAPPPAPPSGRSGAPEAAGTREPGAGGARLRTGARAVWGCQERSRGGREGWARGEPGRCGQLPAPRRGLLK